MWATQSPPVNCLLGFLTVDSKRERRVRWNGEFKEERHKRGNGQMLRKRTLGPLGHACPFGVPHLCSPSPHKQQQLHIMRSNILDSLSQSERFMSRNETFWQLPPWPCAYPAPPSGCDGASLRQTYENAGTKMTSTSEMHSLRFVGGSKVLFCTLCWPTVVFQGSRHWMWKIDFSAAMWCLTGHWNVFFHFLRMAINVNLFLFLSGGIIWLFIFDKHLNR